MSKMSTFRLIPNTLAILGAISIVVLEPQDRWNSSSCDPNQSLLNMAIYGDYDEFYNGSRMHAIQEDLSVEDICNKLNTTIFEFVRTANCDSWNLELFAHAIKDLGRISKHCEGVDFIKLVSWYEYQFDINAFKCTTKANGVTTKTINAHREKHTLESIKMLISIINEAMEKNYIHSGGISIKDVFDKFNTAEYQSTFDPLVKFSPEDVEAINAIIVEQDHLSNIKIEIATLSAYIGAAPAELEKLFAKYNEQYEKSERLMIELRALAGVLNKLISANGSEIRVSDTFINEFAISKDPFANMEECKSKSSGLKEVNAKFSENQELYTQVTLLRIQHEEQHKKIKIMNDECNINPTKLHMLGRRIEQINREIAIEIDTLSGVHCERDWP